MKLKITSLPRRTRNNLESSRAWLTERRAEIADKAKECKEVYGLLAKVLEESKTLHSKAARNSQAAVRLAAAEIQISKLKPELDSLTESLDLDVALVARQIASVRQTDLRDAGVQLLDQLQTLARETLATFFSAAGLSTGAKNFIATTELYGRVLDYATHRGAPRLENHADADRELESTIAEITRILDGQTVADFQPYQP